MISLLDYAPVAAACFAVPQFLPQILKLRTSRDTAGLSWSWAALTAVGNGAWTAYFALAHYLTALIPSSSVTLLAAALTVLLARERQARPGPAILVAVWAAMLAAAAFVLQVIPSVWTAYRTARPTGISAGTWLLILGELCCWLAFGLHEHDPRLVILGATGVTASMLMLTRIRWIGKRARQAALASP